MQNIEKALFNVSVAIGTNYDYPEGEFIQDEFDSENEFRNPYFGDEQTPLKFSKGTQLELNTWLKETVKKYPVMWLVYPVFKTTLNNNPDIETYKKVRIIFAIDNSTEKNIDARIHTTKFVLESIVKEFKRLMRNSPLVKYIKISKTSEITEGFHANYSTNRQESSATNDIWDAMTVDCDIILIPNCIPEPVKQTIKE